MTRCLAAEGNKIPLDRIAPSSFLTVDTRKTLNARNAMNTSNSKPTSCEANLPDKEWYTTGEVAAFCAVVRDTVLKWCQSGKLEAERTRGGHNRIHRSQLVTFLQSLHGDAQNQSRIERKPFCWEFHAGNGRVNEGCLDCVVYHSRTHRCYVLAKIQAEIGHVGLHCTDTCEDCKYYHFVQDRPVRILVASRRPKNWQTFMSGTCRHNCEVELAESGYKCSMLVESFRPDWVIIDSSLGVGPVKELILTLDEDPRLAEARKILVGNKSRGFQFTPILS